MVNLLVPAIFYKEDYSVQVWNATTVKARNTLNIKLTHKLNGRIMNFNSISKCLKTLLISLKGDWPRD